MHVCVYFAFLPQAHVAKNELPEILQKSQNTEKSAKKCVRSYGFSGRQLNCRVNSGFKRTPGHVPAEKMCIFNLVRALNSRQLFI